MWAWFTLPQSNGQSAPTINRETALLGRAFRLAIEERKLSTAPKIRRLPECNPRKGFFEKADLEKLAASLPDYLEGFVRFGYYSGWSKGKISSLTGAAVDRDGREIRLRAEAWR